MVYGICRTQEGQNPWYNYLVAGGFARAAIPFATGFSPSLAFVGGGGVPSRRLNKADIGCLLLLTATGVLECTVAIVQWEIHLIVCFDP